MKQESHLSEPLSQEVRHWLVGEDAADARLDRWLAQQLPTHSRSEIQRWIKEGNVRVNGAVVRASQRVVTNDSIDMVLPQASTATELQPEALPLDILYEDADLLVINKAAGMVVHPAPGHASGTLVNAILHHVPNLEGVGGEKRPGIVHRLDKDTSGVMVVAKHDRALRHLQAQFKERRVVKQYLTLVEGRVREEQGQIIAPIGRHPTDRLRQAVLQPRANDTGPRARQAVTEYQVIGRYAVPLQNDQGHGNFTLVHAHPLTGRTHQIRVHFAWLGQPIVGDPLYGLARQRLRAPRIFLHAERLRFQLPSTQDSVEFSAPLPPDLQTILDTLTAAGDKGRN